VPRLATVTALMGVLLVGSCGGGDSGSCSGATPCGGDLSPARYKIASYCSTIAGKVTSPSCPAGITVVSNSLTFTGTITFNADKSYQSVSQGSGSLVETIPAQCLTAGGMTVTCAQLNTFFRQGEGSCTGSGDCTCTINFGGTPSSASGSYATSGTTLTLTPSGGTASQTQYCATPTSVTIISSSMGSMMSSMGMPQTMTMVTGSATTLLTKE
jgi:hypothetical protein